MENKCVIIFFTFCLLHVRPRVQCNLQDAELPNKNISSQQTVDVDLESLNSEKQSENAESGQDHSSISTESNQQFSNSTSTTGESTMGTHTFYNSTITTDAPTFDYFWVEMDNQTNAKINEKLSHSHRRGQRVELSFGFPFYGYVISNITITTGGFVSTADPIHKWLAATQYIAPLMANFDTRLSNSSYVKRFDNGTACIIQWERVILGDKPEDGEFTFQASLFKNGDIVFAYKTVPLEIESINTDIHPVKVGVSDAYKGTAAYDIRKKALYEYHRIKFDQSNIKNSTVIYLKALPTCLDNKDCNSCLTKSIPGLQCAWCPAMNHCSIGVDRQRQDWVNKRCYEEKLTNESQCSKMNNIDASNL